MGKHSSSLEKVFKNFKADIEIDTPSTTVINWQNEDGEMNHFMKFIINDKTLIVTGDLGSNIFKWDGKGKLNMDWLSTLSGPYLFGKRISVDKSENLWDSDICYQAAVNSLKERIEENDFLKNTANELKKGLKKELDWGNHTENEYTWAKFLHSEKGELYFGEDYWEYGFSLGKEEEPYRHAAIMFAIKEIAAQLKDKKPEIESVLSANGEDIEESQTPWIKN